MSICVDRCMDEVISSVSKWTVGASGAHTKTTGCPGTGVSGVARDAAGKYTMTFQRGVPVGPFLGIQGQVFVAADAAPFIIRPTAYTAETAAAAATLTFEAWDAATPSQAEITNGATVVYTCRWYKTK